MQIFLLTALHPIHMKTGILASVQTTRGRAGQYVNVARFFVAVIVIITIMVQKYAFISNEV